MQNDVDTQLRGEEFFLTVRRLATSLTWGNDTSPYRGTGIDYAQSRLYAPGDPVKAIDWRLTGRTGKVHVKEFESLKHMPVMLVLDQSASMSVGLGRPTKWGWVRMLAPALGMSALRRASPVGLIGTAGGTAGLDYAGFEYAPTHSQDRLYGWAERLRKRVVTEERDGSLKKAVEKLDVMVHERSLVIVLSDLHEPDVVTTLRRLSQRHDMMVLRLEDPAERRINERGVIRATEPNTRMSFFARLGRRREHDGILEDLLESGIDGMRLRIETDFVPGLREFLKTRRIAQEAGAS